MNEKLVQDPRNTITSKPKLPECISGCHNEQFQCLEYHSSIMMQPTASRPVWTTAGRRLH